jgi:hypothetical protein
MRSSPSSSWSNHAGPEHKHVRASRVRNHILARFRSDQNGHGALPLSAAPVGVVVAVVVVVDVVVPSSPSSLASPISCRPENKTNFSVAFLFLFGITREDGGVAGGASHRRPAACDAIGRGRVSSRSLCLHSHHVPPSLLPFYFICELILIFFVCVSGRRRRDTRRDSCTSPVTGSSGSRPFPRRRCSCFGASVALSLSRTRTSVRSSPTYVVMRLPVLQLHAQATDAQHTRMAWLVGGC